MDINTKRSKGHSFLNFYVFVLRCGQIPLGNCSEPETQKEPEVEVAGGRQTSHTRVDVTCHCLAQRGMKNTVILSRFVTNATCLNTCAPVHEVQ